MSRDGHGCSANKGRVHAYFKQTERVLGEQHNRRLEQKVLEAKAELLEAKEGYSAARVVFITRLIHLETKSPSGYRRLRGSPGGRKNVVRGAHVATRRFKSCCRGVLVGPDDPMY